ncbi:MAG: prepilin-type N-terminal cleavage/methylation domain-containing protein [Candidatus Omnitrophota bacterium]|jgi:hypothetical protein
MFPTIKKNRSGFSLIELITASFISLFVFLGAWSIYTMSWSWWHEISPRIQAQQIARIAIMSITEGNVDATAGTDVIGTSTYQRRNGLATACFDPVVSSNISVNDRIDFGLEPDGGNVRAFFLAVDGASDERAVFYQDNNGNTRILNATRGISDLRFDKTVDATTGKISVRVTATVTRNI